MKLLCRCDDSSEAEAIRLRLDAAGIQALVDGVDWIHTSLEFKGAKVQVAEEDFDRAMGILLADQRRIKRGGRWTCSDCREKNDTAFEICWNCQKPRHDLDQQDLEEEASHELTAATADTGSAQLVADRNPYRPVLLAESNQDKRRSTHSHTMSAIGWTLAALLIYFVLSTIVWWFRR